MDDSGNVKHYLKTHPEPFQAVWDGRKGFEWRKNDRPGGFHVGQTIVLQEYDPVSGKYSGRQIESAIRGLFEDFDGIPLGYCILSLGKINRFHSKKRFIISALHAFTKFEYALPLIPDHLSRFSTVLDQDAFNSIWHENHAFLWVNDDKPLYSCDVGSSLFLFEKYEGGYYTGKVIESRITYCIRNTYGIPSGFGIISLVLRHKTEVFL